MKHISVTRGARIIAIGASLALFAAACGTGEDPTGDAARATRATTTTTTKRFARPADAVRHLYGAWRSGNRAAAVEAANREAVAALFARRSTELSGSECNPSADDTRCFMDGEGFSVIFEVAASATRGYQVVGVSFATHDDSTEPAQPRAVATPGRAAVGQTVRLQGSGFTGDPWNAEDAPLYLIGGSGDCSLYAMARDTVVVDDNGNLSGTFVVPATGDCRMAGREAAVAPGKYDLAYSCTACVVGEFEVAA